MKGKISKYTLLNDFHDCWSLYNTLTGSLIRVDDCETQERIKNLLDNKEDSFEFNITDSFFKILLDNGIIIDDSEDETLTLLNMYEHNVVRSKLLKVFPIVTRQCNFRCNYCYEKHENKHMSDKVFDNMNRWILELIKERVFQQVHINFFGGEPMIGYNRIISFLNKLNKGLLDIGFDITKNNFGMTTNGYLLEVDKFLELFRKGVKTYQITIDGVENRHNASRPLVGGKPSWGKIIQNLKDISLTVEEFEIIIRTNYNEEILSDQVEFLEFVSKTFDSRFSVYFEPIKKLGGKNDSNMKVLNELEEVVVTEEMFKVAHNLGLKNATLDYMYGPCGKVCYASEAGSFVVDYDGTLQKCTLVLDDKRNSIGKITDDGFYIDQKKHAQWIANSFINHEQCKECKILPICFGKKCPKAFGINKIENIRCDTDELMIKQYMHYRSQ